MLSGTDVCTPLDLKIVHRGIDLRIKMRQAFAWENFPQVILQGDQLIDFYR